MRIDNLGGQQVGQSNRDAAQAGVQQQGTWRGEVVRVETSESSLLADAAEELTFAQSESADEKRLSERKIESGRRVDLLVIEDITTYLDAMKDQSGPEELAGLAKMMQERGGGAAELVRQSFSDVSQQYLALSYLARHFEGSDPALYEEALDALEELVEDHGPAIRAGLNTVDAAAGFGEGDAAKIASFRESYRETVLGRPSLHETFTSVLERFGADDLPRALHFLVKAVGDDLTARGPSLRGDELRSVLEDVYQLEVLATVLDGCRDLAASMEKNFGVASLSVKDLMSKLVGLTAERWITSSSITGMAQNFGVNATEAKIAFLTQVKTMAREFPLKIFPEIETRDKLLTAIQDALDQAIEEEG